MNAFEALGLGPELVKAVEDLGFVTPTPIQEETIPAVFNRSEDLIALAQTGTGKTAAFGLPIQEQIDILSHNIQALILSPTRELCIQIHKDLESYSKYLPDLNQVAIYGGSDIVKQIKAVKNNPQIIVGTPGRVLDMIKRKSLKVDKIKWLVLDEADEMLNMGFKEELDNILETTPKEKRTLLFSATMPSAVLKIAHKYMNDPFEVSAGQGNIGAENVKHLFYMVQARDRYEALKRIADINPSIYGIVFCRTRQETKDVAEKLKNDGYNADALHGDLSQAQREYVMNGFRKKHMQMLVATDVAARGLDVNDLTHVINYNLPDELEIYIHRSGRTGRAGKSGISISIIHTRELNKIKNLERITSKKFEKKLIPLGREICEKQLFNLVDRMENIEVDESQIGEYMDVIYKKLEWLSREDLIKRFVSLEFNRFLDYYKNAPDLNVKAREERLPRNKSEKDIGRAKSFSRFFINIGSKNRLTPPRIIGLINDYTKRRDLAIGKIDIMKNFSFFEVDERNEKDILKAFKNATFEGVKLSVEISKPDTKQGKMEHKRNRLSDRKKTKRKRM
ncbi:MAG: DEAD/DEAH box helicase [Bacteroidales bacterium]|nr:DEAD/DEAH box helicase [Bacteroidales bacterium]MCF8404782.1 DEAD/DEAH box helicase [Bacteroidales bacterium]